MTDETKVSEAPVETNKATGDESLIENRRAAIENAVITENATPSVPKEVDAPEVEERKPEVTQEKVDEKESEDPIERMKKSVQKRIDKVIAKSKSVEEQLAEAQAELERLKAQKETPKTESSKDDAPPTVEQIEAYIIKMREEGNVKEEIAATRYLIKVEKEMAIKEVQETQTKTQREAEAQRVRADAEMKALANDYVVYDEKGKPDPKAELTLANKNGILFRTAMALYNDKELHAEHYNNPDVVMGFRRAVADAYREIHQQGLLKTPKGDVVLNERKNTREVLADPDTAEIDEATPSYTKPLSDADKVREEIKARKKNRYIKR